MNTNPREINVQPSFHLIEEFRRKGYQCREIKEADATIVYFIHEKKNTAAKTDNSGDAAPSALKKFQGF